MEEASKTSVSDAAAIDVSDVMSNASPLFGSLNMSSAIIEINTTPVTIVS